MTRDSLSLPFSKLDPDVLDANGNVDPQKVSIIKNAIKEHESQGGVVNPSLKSAVELVKGMVPPKKGR